MLGLFALSVPGTTPVCLKPPFRCSWCYPKSPNAPRIGSPCGTRRTPRLKAKQTSPEGDFALPADAEERTWAIMPQSECHFVRYKRLGDDDYAEACRATDYHSVSLVCG